MGFGRPGNTSGIMFNAGIKIIERPDFRAKIAWISIIFIGCIINLAFSISRPGIDKWVALMVGPYIFPLMSICMCRSSFSGIAVLPALCSGI